MSEGNIIEPTYLYQREAEFFGWTPISYIDSVINIVNQYIHASLNSLQDFVDDELGEVLENEQGMQKTSSLLESCVDKNFDKWELYCLQNIFYVPKHVQSTPSPLMNIDWTTASKQEEDEIDMKIEGIRRRLAQARDTRKLVQSNLQKVKKQLSILRQYESTFQRLPELAAKTGVRSVGVEMKTVVDQLQHIVESERKLVVEGKKDKLSELNLLQKKRELGRIDLSADVSDAVKEDELYEKLMKNVPLANLENFSNNANS